MSALSDSTMRRTSPADTLSPTFLAQDTILPSFMVEDSAGILMAVVGTELEAATGAEGAAAAGAGAAAAGASRNK